MIELDRHKALHVWKSRDIHPEQRDQNWLKMPKMRLIIACYHRWLSSLVIITGYLHNVIQWKCFAFAVVMPSKISESTTFCRLNLVVSIISKTTLSYQRQLYHIKNNSIISKTTLSYQRQLYHIKDNSSISKTTIISKTTLSYQRQLYHIKDNSIISKTTLSYQRQNTFLSCLSVLVIITAPDGSVFSLLNEYTWSSKVVPPPSPNNSLLPNARDLRCLPVPIDVGSRLVRTVYKLLPVLHNNKPCMWALCNMEHQTSHTCLSISWVHKYHRPGHGRLVTVHHTKTTHIFAGWRWGREWCRVCRGAGESWYNIWHFAVSNLTHVRQSGM